MNSRFQWSRDRQQFKPVAEQSSNNLQRSDDDPISGSVTGEPIGSDTRYVRERHNIAVASRERGEPVSVSDDSGWNLKEPNAALKSSNSRQSAAWKDTQINGMCRTAGIADKSTHGVQDDQSVSNPATLSQQSFKEEEMKKEDELGMVQIKESRKPRTVKPLDPEVAAYKAITNAYERMNESLNKAESRRRQLVEDAKTTCTNTVVEILRGLDEQTRGRVQDWMRNKYREEAE